MRNDSSRTVLVLVLALLMASPVLAGQAGKQAAAKEAGQEVAQEAKSQTEGLDTKGAEAALEQKALPATEESLDDEGDPPAEPQAVVKTKTKSNQSND